MLSQRRSAHDKVATQLLTAERANDEALVAHARLLSAMIEARTEANVAFEVGLDAVESLVDAISYLRDARRMVVTTHQRLAEVKIDVGLGAVAIGGSGEKPPASARLLPAADAA